jgi:mannose-6-phosphate isomerase-like protein (cupin superfamily)
VEFWFSAACWAACFWCEPLDVARPKFYQSKEMKMEVVNLADKLSKITEHWSPKIVGEINDSYVKLVKFKGAFVWHHHDDEDEMFLVVKGRMKMRFRDRDVFVNPGEFIIVPKGVEHLPEAEDEVHIVLFEPKTTLNTGNVRNEHTVLELERL